MRALVNIRNVWMEHIATVTAFRYSLPVLKIYSVRNVYYRFLVLAANIATQPMMRRSGWRNGSPIMGGLQWAVAAVDEAVKARLQ